MSDLERIVQQWAETQPAIRTLIIVGSQARRDHPADAWSDLDMMVFVTDFSPYLSGSAWLAPLGKVWMCVPLQEADNEPERLILFEGGQKLDFHFFPVSELERIAHSQQMESVYQRGYRILLDKDGLAAQLPSPTYSVPRPERPSEETFLRCVDLFWYSAAQLAKTIRRRDLWVVKTGDGLLKRSLLDMLEWHAQAKSGWQRDTWHGGRFISEWIDPQMKDALNDLFGRFDAKDSWRALLASMALFHRVGLETGWSLGYAYPALLDENISEYVRSLYVQDGFAD